MNTRSRSFVVVINNDSYEDLDQLLRLEVRYMIFGFEVGAQCETPHIQGYAYFTNKQTISGLHKLIPRAKFILANGTPAQNKKYCSKEGDFYEFGTLPVKGHATLEKIIEAYEDPTSNFQVYHQYRRSYEDYLLKTHNLEHDRELIMCHETKLIEYLGTRFSKNNVCVGDYELWNNEDVLITTEYSTFPFKQWFEGFVPRAKRGYQIIKIDPKVVIYSFSDMGEFNIVNKKYDSIISTVIHAGEQDERTLHAE